jgi:ABC-type uncharacterized transport system YnjBCD permease subunit
VNALRKARIWRVVPEGVTAEVVDAGPTPVPGLAVIYYRWGTNPGWEVLHEASGFALANARDPEHALAIAVALGRVANWTRAGSDLQREPGMREAVILAVQGAGGWFGGPLVNDETLAAAEGGAA